jgi:ribonuclease VapC
VIVVDTSALIAILNDESQGPACRSAIASAEEAVMSAATFAEALVVAGRRDMSVELLERVDLYAIRVIPLDAAGARRVGEAHARWGRGAGTAGLNMGDCFAYAAATALGAPLLYVGDDFSRTDVAAAA